MAKDATRKHFSLIRSLVLADVLTMGNAAAGTGVIFCCLAYVASQERSILWWAFALIPLALVFDILDGHVARWRARHSYLGADLDSLADIISFGVAPAALAYVLGMRGGWDVLVLIFFVVCGLSRLARYNATAEMLSGEDGKVRYYEGTPIPTSVLMVILLAVAFANGATDQALWLGVLTLGPWELHPMVLGYALLGTTMASATLRIPKP